MEFPLMNVSFENWHEGYTEFSTVFIKDDKVNFRNRNKFQDQKYIDCNGDVYKVLSVMFLGDSWKKLLKFIPGFYKGNLVFDKTKEIILIEDLKKDVLIKFKDALSVDESYKNLYITRVENAKSFKQVVDFH